MNYTDFDKGLVFENTICYKYNKQFDKNNIRLLNECYNNWFKIDINQIIKLKEIISDITDYNFDIKGYKKDNMIILFNNIKTRYYIIIFSKKIKFYWIHIK